jgi:serine/threonine-protein kinase HipA
MRIDRCLCCYQPLGQKKFLHSKCSKKVFSQEGPPKIDFGMDDIQSLALKTINKSLSIPGFQRKLSADLSSETGTFRLTIADGLPGYIVKMPTPQYPHIVENEALTMELARLCDLRTAEATLLPLSSGELVLVVKRFDRRGSVKFAQEDFCQLVGQLTSEKYTGSIERVGKRLRELSSTPGLDVARLFELVLFCFLTGNADMHLKNFSIHTRDGHTSLTPAYDLLNTRLLIPEDREESALTINGKRRKLKNADFLALGAVLGLSPKIFKNIVRALTGKKAMMMDLIHKSYLDGDLKDQYIRQISTNLKFLANN